MRVRATICALALAALGACKQGAGDACQITDDCESPLQCNASTGQCQRGSEETADAAPLADAALPPDAGEIDAAPDAGPPDAGPDAGPDAAPDAAL
ncbi:MAG TPA: hypothetical protein VNO33_01315 [Kofleriaceae bacterium]|nr:hypothetical protein [Kofleriaceae bacterium]